MNNFILGSHYSSLTKNCKSNKENRKSLRANFDNESFTICLGANKRDNKRAKMWQVCNGGIIKLIA